MVTVQLDEAVVQAMRVKDGPIDGAVQELIVFELYRRGELSRGRAAELLGMRLGDFLERAGELGIPYLDLTDEEWDAERARIDAWIAGR